MPNRPRDNSDGDLRRIPFSRRARIASFRPISAKAVEHESALDRGIITLANFLDAKAAIVKVYQSG